MAKRKRGDQIIVVFGIVLPRNPDKEEAIAIARLNRVGKGMLDMPRMGVNVDGSNLADTAEALENVLCVLRRAKASAHNSGE